MNEKVVLGVDTDIYAVVALVKEGNTKKRRVLSGVYPNNMSIDDALTLVKEMSNLLSKLINSFDMKENGLQKVDKK